MELVLHFSAHGLAGGRVAIPVWGGLLMGVEPVLHFSACGRAEGWVAIPV